MEFQASHKYAHVTPRKARPVADLVRGLNANRALEVLEFSPRRTAGLLKMVIRSALANASQQQGINLNKLVVTKVFVNEGPLQKRGRPVARGRFHRIMKKLSHLHVVLGEPAAPPDGGADAADAKSAAKTRKTKSKKQAEPAGGRI